MSKHYFSIPSADEQSESRCEQCGRLLPDSLELNDYILEHFPQVHAVTKHSDNSTAVYTCHLGIWLKTAPCQ